MEFFGIAGVAAITVIAYLLGEAAKACESIANKWIPIICGTAGLVLGVAALFIMPDFPAHDYITAAAVGIVSGLAATGAHEGISNLRKGKSDDVNNT